MANEERNALAELAENLEHDNFFGCDHYDREVWVGKAQRIIAELGDVFGTYAFDPHGNSFLLLADRAVKKCRAIAEE